MRLRLVLKISMMNYRLAQVSARDYILQRGVQWKQGVVIRMLLYTIVLYNTTPIHCTPLRLHPPVMNARQAWPTDKSFNINATWSEGESALGEVIYIYIYIYTETVRIATS